MRSTSATLVGLALALVLAVAAGCENSAPRIVPKQTSVAPPPPPSAPPSPSETRLEQAQESAALPAAPPPEARPPADASQVPGVVMPKMEKWPEPVASDPSQPIIGPMAVADFVSEFRKDSAAATKKYERRRIRLYGEVSGISTRLGKHSMGIGLSKSGHQVALRLESRPSLKLDDLVMAEGDFQLVNESGAPTLANCTIEKDPCLQ